MHPINAITMQINNHQECNDIAIIPAMMTLITARMGTLGCLDVNIAPENIKANNVNSPTHQAPGRLWTALCIEKISYKAIIKPIIEKIRARPAPI